MSVWSSLIQQLQAGARPRADLAPRITAAPTITGAPLVDPISEATRLSAAQAFQPVATFAGRVVHRGDDPLRLLATPPVEPVDLETGSSAIPVLGASIIPPITRSERRLIKNLARGAEQIPASIGGGTGKGSLLDILRSKRTEPTRFVAAKEFEFLDEPGTMGLNMPGPVVAGQPTRLVLVPGATRKGLVRTGVDQPFIPIIRGGRSTPQAVFHEGLHTTLNEAVKNMTNDPRSLIAVRDSMNAALPRHFKVDFTDKVYRGKPLNQQVAEVLTRLYEFSGELGRSGRLEQFPGVTEGMKSVWKELAALLGNK